MRKKIVILGILAATVGVCIWMALRSDTAEQFPSLRIVEVSTQKPERTVWLVISNGSNRAIYYQPDSRIRVSFMTKNIWQATNPDYYFNGFNVLPAGFEDRIGAQLPENAVAAKFSLKCQMLSCVPNWLLTIGNNHLLRPIVVPFVTSFEGIDIPTEWSSVYYFNGTATNLNSVKLDRR